MNDNDWAGFYSFSAKNEAFIKQLQKELKSKDNLITQQTQNINNLKKQVEEFEKQVEDLKKQLEEKK